MKANCLPVPDKQFGIPGRAIIDYFGAYRNTADDNKRFRLSCAQSAMHFRIR